MKLEVLQHWRKKQVAIGGTRTSFPRQIERIGVMSVRLDKHHADLEEIHRKLERLESQLEKRPITHMKIATPALEGESASLDSDYWIG